MDRKIFENIGNSCKKVNERFELGFLRFPYREQEKYYEKERNKNEVAKLAMENERRQWILK